MWGKLIPILFIALLVWIIFFHRRLPVTARRTGRGLRDLKDAGRELIDDSEVEGSPLARYETQSGKALTARVLMQHPLVPDVAMQERVLKTGRRLAAASSRQELRYRFAVIEGEEPGAMAIPGGSIFLTRTLVELCGAEDARLAGVIAHEVAHIDRRHAIRSLAARTATKAGLKIFSFGRGAILANLIGRAEGLITGGYSRENELEADSVGARLAADAGYDHRGLAIFLRQILEHQPAVAAAEFFRSHPPLVERITALGAQGADE